MATYVVTGGAGFIGSNLTEFFVKRGHTVRVLDDFSTGRRENLSGADAWCAESGGRFELGALVMPATLEHIRDISNAGERMPAKSTYFYPKLLSGLVINPLD